MDYFKINKNALLMHKGNYQFRSNVMYYMQRMNNNCMPLLNELGIAKTIKDVIRYCSEGGKDRLKNDCLLQIGATTNQFLRQLAEERFNEVMNRHPNFTDDFNNWYINSILTLDVNGQLGYDRTLIDEYSSVYLNNNDSIHTYNKIVEICDLLNKISSPDFRQHAQLLEILIAYDESTKKYVPNNSLMSDELLLEIKNGSNGLDNYRDFEKMPSWYKNHVIDMDCQKKERYNTIKQSFGL